MRYNRLGRSCVGFYFGQLLYFILPPPRRIPRIHTRNGRCDPLQLLLSGSGHQVVALSRSHTATKQVNKKTLYNTTIPPAALFSATTHIPSSTPPRPHRHSNRLPLPSRQVKTPRLECPKPLPIIRHNPQIKPFFTPQLPHQPPNTPSSSTVRAPQRVVEAC